MTWWTGLWIADALIILAAGGLYLMARYYPFPGGDEGMAALLPGLASVVLGVVALVVTAILLLVWVLT